MSALIVADLLSGQGPDVAGMVEGVDVAGSLIEGFNKAFGEVAEALTGAFGKDVEIPAACPTMQQCLAGEIGQSTTVGFEVADANITQDFASGRTGGFADRILQENARGAGSLEV